MGLDMGLEPKLSLGGGGCTGASPIFVYIGKACICISLVLQIDMFCCTASSAQLNIVAKQYLHDAEIIYSLRYEKDVATLSEFGCI